MRLLTHCELGRVAGGAGEGDNYSVIVVNGHRDGGSYDWWPTDTNPGSWDHGAGGSSDGQTNPPDQSHPQENADHLTPEKVREIVDKVDQVRAAVQQLVDTTHRSDLQIKIGNFTTSAEHALESLGHLATAVQAGTVGAELAQGDKAWFHDAVTLTAGAAAGEAVASMGAGPEAIASFLASNIADHAADWIIQSKEAFQQYEQQWNNMVQHYVDTHSDIPAGTYNNPVDLLNGMMGFPSVPPHHDLNDH